MLLEKWYNIFISVKLCVFRKFGDASFTTCRIVGMSCLESTRDLVSNAPSAKYEHVLQSE